MQLNIISILNNGSNNYIIKAQKEHPLKIVGFSNVKYDDRSALKFSIYFFCENCKNCKQKRLLAHNIDPAFMNHFKVGSYIYKNAVIEKEKLYPLQLDVDFQSIEYVLYKGLTFEEQYILSKTAYGLLASNALSYINSTFFAKYVYKNLTIFIPTYLIGKFFYFPNTRIREAFHAQNIEHLHYQEHADCNNKNFVLKTRTGQQEDTIKLICLYQCNEFARNMFYRTSSIIKSEEKKSNCFMFPLQETSKIKLLGKFLKGIDTDKLYFVVYDLIDISFKEICGKDITYSFMGKNKVHPVKTYNIYKDTVDFTKIDGLELVNLVNSKLQEAKSVVNKNTSGFDDVKITKTVPHATQDVFFKDFNAKTNDVKKTVVAGTANDITSINGNLVKVSSFATFNEGIKELEKLLGIELILRDFINLAYIQFKYKNRYVIIVEYGDGKSGTYIFSSSNDELWKRKQWLFYKLNEKSVKVQDIVKMLKKYNVCFHPIQYHTSTPKNWAERIIEKLNKPMKCK